MKKISYLILICLLLLVGCSKPINPFTELKEITFQELDSMIENKETMFVYFGWVENCGDSKNIQDHYFNEFLKDNPEYKEKVLVVNLDKELPDALENKELREPMFETYGVHYSPTVIYYENGEQKELIEWTPMTSDPKYGISKEKLDAFFQK